MAFVHFVHGDLVKGRGKQEQTMFEDLRRGEKADQPATLKEKSLKAEARHTKQDEDSPNTTLDIP